MSEIQFMALKRIIVLAIVNQEGLKVFYFNRKWLIPAILLKTVAVDKNNMKQTVIKDGYLKTDQLHFAH